MSASAHKFPSTIAPKDHESGLATGRKTYSVLHVGKFYPPHMGGMETHLQWLCGELRKSLDVEVIVANDGDQEVEEIVDGVAVSRVPTKLFLASTPMCPGMIAKIRHSTADIVHIHWPNPSAVLAYLAGGHPGRLVITYHSDTVRQRVLGTLFEPLLHSALRRSAAIVTSSAAYTRTSKVLQEHLDRCHVIPFGIPLEQFENCSRAIVTEIRQRYGERIILSIGRLVYYKGLEYLIRAMSKIRGRLLIAGDGPLRAALHHLTLELGLGNKVTFLGRVEETIPYYHAADVFVLPSIVRTEAFGIVQIEAMAAGIPVVNTALDSGVPSVSLHGKTGLTVPPADPESLAAALNHLLDNDNLRRSFGAAARYRARTEFNLETMLSRTMSLYDSVLHEVRPAMSTASVL